MYPATSLRRKVVQQLVHIEALRGGREEEGKGGEGKRKSHMVLHDFQVGTTLMVSKLSIRNMYVSLVACVSHLMTYDDTPSKMSETLLRHPEGVLAAP